MKAFLQTIALLLVATLLTGCGSKLVIPIADFITDVDAGETIIIQNGGTLHLDLVSINGDNRTWYIDGSLPEILTQIKEPNYRAFKNNYLKGENVIWEFRAAKIGVSDLTLAYKGEKETVATETFSVTIDVREAINIFEANRKSEEEKTNEKQGDSDDEDNIEEEKDDNNSRKPSSRIHRRRR